MHRILYEQSANIHWNSRRKHESEPPMKWLSWSVTNGIVNDPDSKETTTRNMTEVSHCRLMAVLKRALRPAQEGPIRRAEPHWNQNLLFFCHFSAASLRHTLRRLSIQRIHSYLRLQFLSASGMVLRAQAPLPRTIS
jgi:hypothetical protein